MATNASHNSEAPANAFARMEIVLPGTFEGGTLRIRSGAQAVSEAFVDHHGSTTSVVSWFLSSVLSANQVTAGAAVIMSYYIRCPSGVSNPVPPTDPEPVLRAIDAIKAWAEGGIAKVRLPIAIPLRNENGGTSSNAGGLSEEEKNKLRLAESMLDGMDVCAGLAVFERRQRGCGIKSRQGVYGLDREGTTTVTLISVRSRTGREVVVEPVALSDEDTPAALATVWSKIETAPRIGEVRYLNLICDRDAESLPRVDVGARRNPFNW